MDVTSGEIAAFASAVLALVAVGTVWVTTAVRFAKLELKVETMWAFQLRRGVAEAVTSGIAEMNSPLRFKDTALAVLDPIHDRLVAFGHAHENLSKTDFVAALENEFGDDLVKYYCIPFKMSLGSCLLAAMAVAYGNPINVSEFTEPAPT